MIQDKVFAIGSLLMTAMLMPALINPSTVIPLTTSITISVVVFLFGLAQFSLKCKLGAVANWLNSLTWLMLAIWRH